MEQARDRAYEAARVIKFPGAWYRRDIAGRGPRADR
jgi:phosphoribosylamine-glycine ligase